MRPYREPTHVEVDPAVSLGSERSLHVPPPLLNALVGPLLITVLVLVVAMLAGASALVSATVAAACLALLAWPPLRTHGRKVTLHKDGIVLSRKTERSIVAFADIDEIWFEIPRLQSSRGARLRALRLVTFDGQVHRVPLLLDAGGPALANAILQACATPLIAEARQALTRGETLTFGSVQLGRRGITVKGAHASWSDIRFARLRADRLVFFRQVPLFSWRTVRLDRIPNPSVFCALVARSVTHLKLEGRLAVEIDLPGEVTSSSRELALRTLAGGAALFLIGLAVTCATYAAHHSYYVIAVGPMLYGSFRFVRGLVDLT